MRRRYREFLIAAGLWILLVLSAVYVSGLLFPAQTISAGYIVAAGIKQNVKIMFERFTEEMLPAIPYVFGYDVYLDRRQEQISDQSYLGYLRLAGSKEDISEEKTAEIRPADVCEETEPVQQEMFLEASAGTGRLERFREMSQRGGWDLAEMLQFDTLLNRLYVVSEGTSITENELNPEKLLSYDLSVTPKEGYDILIYHTHSQEAYADSVPGDVAQTVVGMGELLKEQLEKYGFSVLHHKGIYDMTDGKLDRDPAYTKALPVISSIIEAYPEIEVIIDLHRDGVREDVHLVQEINGKQTARIMYFNGLCRSENGEREDVFNPYREENMAMSLQLALTTMTDYPGLTRCIYLRSSRYNLHLRGKSALIEVGAQTNTVEEVRNAIPVLADVIHKVLTN